MAKRASRDESEGGLQGEVRRARRLLPPLGRAALRALPLHRSCRLAQRRPLPLLATLTLLKVDELNRQLEESLQDRNGSGPS
jgi:hypothetical protein